MGILGNTIDAYRQSRDGDFTFCYAGIEVTCSHCGGNQFTRDSRLLNSRSLTFLDLDWANASAHILICKNCGHIEWFVEQ